MTVTVDLERWVSTAAAAKFGVCGVCHRERDHDGKPLYVVRANHGRVFRCFECSTKPKSRRRTVTATTTSGELQRLPLEKLKASEENRDVGDVTELAQSIKAQGLLQPIVAVQQNGHFLIVAGARRAAAARKAGLKEIDVIVREFSDVERVLAMTVENLQREDLTALEEATLYRRLTADLGLTQRDLAGKVGKSQGHISKRLALLELPDDVRAKVDSGEIPVADAVELTRLVDYPKRLKAALEERTYHSLATRVEQQLNLIKQDKMLDQREEQLESNAVPTVRVTGGHNLPKGVHRLVTPQWAHDPHALQVGADAHAVYGCHAIALHIDWQGNVAEFPVCTDRTQHPKIKTLQEKRGSTGGGQKHSPELANANELDQAKIQRLAFMRALLSTKTFPKATLVDLAVDGMINRAIETGEEDISLACVILGLVESDEDARGLDLIDALTSYIAGGEPQRLRAAAALTLANDEAYHTSRWNPWGGEAAAHFSFLEKHGYEPGPAERKMLPATKAAA